MANKQVCKKFTWVIEDFSLQTEFYSSDRILIDDCEWFLFIDPTKNYVNSLYMGLQVYNSESLPSGWRRYVKLRLYVAKQYLGELALLNGDSYLSELHLWFDLKKLGFGFSTNVPLTKLLDEKEGFLVNGELMIVAELEVHEAIGTYNCSKEYEGEYEYPSEMKLEDDPNPCDILNQTQQSINVNGFQVLGSQVNYVRCIFERHPDIAVGFRSKNQHIRETSMNFLLILIQTLCKSVEKLSNEDLVDADIALTFLKDVGFKVDWLERKLDQVKEKKVKEQSSFARLRELDDSLLKLQLRCSDLDAQVKKEETELSATRTPLSFYDVV